MTGINYKIEKIDITVHIRWTSFMIFYILHNELFDICWFFDKIQVSLLMYINKKKIQFTVQGN